MATSNYKHPNSTMISVPWQQPVVRISRQVLLLTDLKATVRVLNILKSRWLEGVHISYTYLNFYHSPSSLYPSSAGSFSLFFFFFGCSFCFSQVFQLYDRYLGVGTRENNASSCFDCTIADALPLCRNANFTGRLNSRRHQTVQSVFTLEW